MGETKYDAIDIWGRFGEACSKSPSEMTLEDIAIKSLGIGVIVLAILFTIVVVWALVYAIKTSKSKEKDIINEKLSD